MLEVTDLAVWYPTSGIAVSELTFSAASGQILLLTGRNGCGTSTALKAIAAGLPAGSRRQGRIMLDGINISAAHPDDLAGVITTVGDTSPACSLRIGDLIHLDKTGRRPITMIAPTQIVTELGLDGHLGDRVGDVTRSLRARAVLAAGLIAAPRLLLADQPLAPMESSWRDSVCRLLRAHADAGMTIVWAEHHLTHALAVADQVIEFIRPGRHPQEPTASALPAWKWRPRTLPWTPLQQVTTSLGLTGPGADDVDHLHAALQSVVRSGRRQPPTHRDTGQLTVTLNDHEKLLIRDDQMLRIACATTEQAATAYDKFAAANDFTLASTQPDRTLADICQRQDQSRGELRGTTWARVYDAWPMFRARDVLAQHSSGEQALMTALLDVGCGPTVPLLDVGQYLDAWTRDRLLDQIALRVRTGQTVVWITTDAEELPAAERVIVTNGEHISADGRATAIADRLPYLPRLAAVCCPLRIMTAEEAIAGVEPADSAEPVATAWDAEAS